MKYAVIGLVLGFLAGWLAHGWYSDSNELKEVKADDVQQQEEKKEAGKDEAVAAEAGRTGDGEQKVIIRYVTRYLSDPARNNYPLDADSVRARQAAMDSANCIKGFDDCAVQGGNKSGN